ncbi:MAG: hypothetical protein K0R14_38 [Burkholderiales bacterium]|jgi:hypothetical protein|nr:hypothetical protein [Burkholderiales bacterium]
MQKIKSQQMIKKMLWHYYKKALKTPCQDTVIYKEIA